MSAPLETRQEFQPQPLTIPADFGGLTLKQGSFCDHYLLTGNATDAAIKAGYTANRDTAAQIGSQLLRNLKIQTELKRRLGLSVASANEVLESLTFHARGDLAKVLQPDGSFNLRAARKRGVSKLLKKLKVKTRTDKDGNVTVEHEFEIHDPQAALEKLGRFHKLFTDRVETDLDIDVSALANLLRAVCERARAMQQESAHGGPASSSSQPIIDVTPVDHAPLLSPTSTATND